MHFNSGDHSCSNALQMIEHGAAHGLSWARAIVVLTSNVGASHAMQLGKDNELVRVLLSCLPRWDLTVLFPQAGC
jgi:hypothetical protein